MTVALEPAQISPVNVEERKNLGIRSGDTVRVHQKIQEKGKTRIQVFEGLVLARKHGSEPGATFTVRATLSGVGVEKIFPLYSPLIDKIEIVRRSKVRRAKLYYIREKVAREIRRQLRNMTLMGIATESEKEVAEAAERAAKEAEEAATAAEAKAAEAEKVAAEKKAADPDGANDSQSESTSDRAGKEADDAEAEPAPESEPTLESTEEKKEG